MLEKLFHLKENKTSVRTELIAGLTTFLAMAYILGVNPSVLGDAGMDVSSVFLATALSAAVASVIMGTPGQARWPAYSCPVSSSS